eukprot:CAMPEP_0202960626 /NCGR_PEP_ID=MMETSP1396-20130829/4785_1 /ASSEMBLY_ACC=CAM_ASM_000872 /TAXON_ID= /ORGANISM="Pseudokeronopsis sp., Strain Brazil" /LENGTH=78 /DNA_ID=CAMNT_0049679977 /DNA_START=190 /DNA_END=426 /DNA_ORIENTATION=+
MQSESPHAHGLLEQCVNRTLKGLEQRFLDEVGWQDSQAVEEVAAHKLVEVEERTLEEEAGHSSVVVARTQEAVPNSRH